MEETDTKNISDQENKLKEDGKKYPKAIKMILKNYFLLDVV